VAAHLDLLQRQRALGADLPQMETKWLQLEWVKKTLRVSASIYKANWLRNGRMAKFTRS
jgi:hypothetical protein